MASIVDDRGYNQGFKPCYALTVRTERRSDYIVQNMSVGPQSRVLELGCGTGELSQFIASKTTAGVVGSDMCVPFIEEAQRSHTAPNLEYRVLHISPTSIQSLAGERFDYIVGNGILHHLYHELDDVLPILRGMLRDGGRLLFWEPNLFNPYVFLIFKIGFLRKLARLEPTEMAFTGNFIKKKLQMSGFKKVQTEYRDFLLPNTPKSVVPLAIHIGALAERIPIVDHLSQSIFVSAQKVDDSKEVPTK